VVPDTANREHAAALAEQLDAYLAGDRSRTRVAEIEGVTEESLEWIVRYARRHIKESFGL